ncbi:AAA family ATPase [Streptomyces sp. NPDC057101]|uniref:helix-turn-helix transcriptional regulator n=1 Tax=Streptomyces sp. NPDC057101 TaxID=3346020 RepID=UPI0036323FC5
MSEEGLFAGRDSEFSQLRSCTSDVREGRPWTVLIAGEPGVGKTELVRRWLASPSIVGFSVLRAKCSESEQDIAYGVIQQLISPVQKELLEDFPLLKAPISSAAPPFEVGRQLLALIDVMQSEMPVVVVIDDLHWVDAASLHAWGFVLRRLEADSVLTLLTLRTVGRPVTPDVDEMFQRLMMGGANTLRLNLRGLDTNTVGKLISKAGGISDQIEFAEHLRQHTAGNPLYVRTVLAELSNEDLNGDPVTATLPVPSSLATAIRSQLLNLPLSAQALVEAAAVLGTPTALNVVSELAGADDPVPALEVAVLSGLLHWSPNDPLRHVEVAHALQQKAILEGIPHLRLRELHTQAARLVSERESWIHRVAAAEAGDEQLVSDLITAADAEFNNGEAERSATLLLWAADLSTERAERERHLLTAAARLSAINQRYARIVSLLPRVRSSMPCAKRSLVLGAHAMLRGTLPTAESYFAAALTEGQQEEDHWSGFMARVWLSSIRNFMGRYEDGIDAARQALAMVPNSSWAIAGLSQGLALAKGPEEALSHLTPVTSSLRQSTGSGIPVDAFLLTVQGWVKAGGGDLHGCVEDCRRALALSRSRGATAFPDYAYVGIATAQYLLGEWEDARISIGHAQDISSHGDGQAAAYPLECSVASWIAAGQGDWHRAEEKIRMAENAADSLGSDLATVWTAISRAILAQARGDYTTVLQNLTPLARAEAGWQRHGWVYWLPLESEALIRLGQLKPAAAAVARLTSTSQQIPCLRAAAAWLSGQLAEASREREVARARYEEGLVDLPGADVVPLHRAMLEISYAKLLRSLGLATEAGKWFDLARDRLQALQAIPFLQRNIQDSPASGDGLQAPADKRWLGLTRREKDIALLIGRGLTNREIAGELFVSSKTVEYHLGHVYGKCSFASRRELRNYIQKKGFLAESSI